MKKTILAVVGGLMMTATAAHAEHKLLVTDILDAKQVEAQAKFEYSKLSGTITGGEETGRWRTEAGESFYSLGVGLGHGLEMTAAVPYVFEERTRKEFGAEEPGIEKRDGFGDFAIEAKYRILGGEEEPFTLVTGLDLKFDTAGTGATRTPVPEVVRPEARPFVSDTAAGSGTTDVAPFIAASANLPHHHIPYAIYKATIRNHGAQDTHTVSLGLEKELNHTFTLDGKFDANFNTSGRYATGNQDFVFELTTYVQVAHNFYLLPTVSYVLATETTDKISGEHFNAADGYRAGLSLYYLF